MRFPEEFQKNFEAIPEIFGWSASLNFLLTSCPNMGLLRCGSRVLGHDAYKPVGNVGLF